MDYTVHGILQARILEGVPFPSPADLPDPGIEPGSPALQADSLPTELPGKPQAGVAPMENIWRVLKKLKTELPYDPATPLLGIYPDKTRI